MPEPVTLFFGRRVEGRFEFVAEDSHHLVRVLRHGIGDLVWATDGGGTVYAVELRSVDPRAAAGLIASEHQGVNEPSAELVLIQGLLHPPKMDWLIEKATELGATEIRPVGDGARAGPGRLKRWQRIGRSAAKQCRRGRIPAIADPTSLATALHGLPRTALRLLADPGGGPLPAITPAAGPVVLAVGPERGFTPDAKSELLAAGFARVTLGSRRLRAETAAIALLALVASVVDRPGSVAPWSPAGERDSA